MHNGVRFFHGGILLLVFILPVEYLGKLMVLFSEKRHPISGLTCHVKESLEN